MLEKSAIIEIIIHLLSWLVFVICGFIKDFIPNSYFIFQIYQAKSFEMRYGMSLYLNFSARYSLNALKTQNYYPDLIDIIFLVQVRVMILWDDNSPFSEAFFASPEPHWRSTNHFKGLTWKAPWQVRLAEKQALSAYQFVRTWTSGCCTVEWNCFGCCFVLCE